MMILCHFAAASLEAEASFRRISGYREIPFLVPRTGGRDTGCVQGDAMATYHDASGRIGRIEYACRVDNRRDDRNRF